MTGERRDGVFQFLTHNWGLKVTAIMSAIVLFALVHGAEDAQRSVFVGVTVIPPPTSSGKMLISEIPDQIRLTLRGSRSQVNDVRDLRVEIDLTDTDLRYYYFADDDFDVPAGVTIEQFAPASIPLVWADRLERRLPVQPRLVGELPEGLALASPPRVTPAEILVIGPSTELEDLRAVTTSEIDLSPFTVGPSSRTVPLVIPTPHSRFLDEAPARVSIDVVREVAERSLNAVAVVVEGLETERIEPAAVTVNVQGAPALVALIDAAQVHAVAKWQSAAAQNGVIRAALEIEGLPVGTDVLAVEPAEVTITTE